MDPLTRCQSGRSIFCKSWQALVVTESTPAHHSREKSQRSLTTHMFTVTFFLFSSLQGETADQTETSIHPLRKISILNSPSHPTPSRGPPVFCIHCINLLTVMQAPNGPAAGHLRGVESTILTGAHGNLDLYPGRPPTRGPFPCTHLNSSVETLLYLRFSRFPPSLSIADTLL
uniref:Uncharacterized protein n=1 Tax=Scleropages formosus TaxID=113540 RepID=A0A8C9TCQ4_SCLFO